MSDRWFKRLFLLLQIAVVTVFLGRAWQHLYWDAPYRTLLWDEVWMKPIIQLFFSMEWEDYVTSMAIDRVIQHFIRATGAFYVLAALAAIFINQRRRIATAILWLGALSLLLLAALYSKEKFFHLGQFLEYVLQWSSPIFLIFLSKNQAISSRFLFGIKIAIAFTFVCHGLYAIDYYPRPGEFSQMTMVILQINETNAIHFLKIAGLLDFIVSGLLFLPGKIGKIALWYCVFWGFFTTLARCAAPLMLGTSIENMLLQNLHESLYRFPHFLLPLFVVLALDRQNIRNAQQV